jgi:hypothetical protein
MVRMFRFETFKNDLTRLREMFDIRSDHICWFARPELVNPISVGMSFGCDLMVYQETVHFFQ